MLQKAEKFPGKTLSFPALPRRTWLWFTTSQCELLEASESMGAHLGNQELEEPAVVAQAEGGRDRRIQV